jgi:hypothetical protein
VDVCCDDGTATASYRLDRPESALLVPPGIWAREAYLAPGTVLAVLCDRPYESDDYLRDYEQFKAFRRRWHEESSAHDATREPARPLSIRTSDS